ncbi:MAG: hypothetical protein DRG27_04520 [Deltaproteobacteria bacterium]|nr:MAG: hypothetical protein DRG27_04520 [Deltaproteobacteria bacterium]
MKGISRILLAVVVIGLIVLTVPGAMGSITSFFSTEPQPCDTAPYNENCICGENERKIYVPWLGIPKWSCENVEQLILDPESPTFEQDAIEFVKAYLSANCGDVCTNLECGDLCSQGGIPQDGSDRCISAVFGYGETGERIVNVECIATEEWYDNGLPKSGYILWRMNFFVESETGIPKAYTNLFQNYCVDPTLTERCEPPVEEVPYTFSVFSVFQPQLGSKFPPADKR